MVSRRTENTDVTESFITYINTENEWAPGTETTDNTSVTARPGALTFDYKVQFDIGPIELSNTSDGLLSKIWRVRRVEYNFWISRENDEGDDWREEELLFSIDEETQLPNEFPSQFGFSFDQNGRPVLTFALNGTVFLWWFDPQVSQQVIREIDSGRTPVVLLDEKRQFNIPNSDLLIFYITNTDDLVYRRQRDRYNDLFTTPVTSVPEANLELIYKTVDQRLSVVYTTFDEGTVKYDLNTLTTVPYPQFLSDSYNIVQASAVSFSLRLANFNAIEPLQILSSDVSDFNIRPLNVFIDAGPELYRIDRGDVADFAVIQVVDPEIFVDVPESYTYSNASVNDFFVNTILLEIDAGPDNYTYQEASVVSFSIQ